MANQCPQCGGDFVHRSRRKGAVDIILSFLFIYPFRCQNCSHSFRAFKPLSRYTKQRLDYRHHARVETNFPVSFSWEQARQEARVTNISLDGCQMETDAQLTEGVLLKDLQLEVPGFLPEIGVEVAVVRSVQTTSVDIEFLRFAVRHKEQLGRFMLKQLASERRRRADSEQKPSP